LADGLGDLEFGADAVGGRNQDRVAVAGRLGIEQRTEAAEAGIGAGAGGRLGVRLNGLDQGVSGVDIDPRLGIGFTLGKCGIAGYGNLL
jgi:hypothetical protein